MSHPTSRSWAARLGVAGVAILALGVLPTPAHADDEPPYFLPSVSTNIKISAAGSKGTAVPVLVAGHAVVKPVVTFDFAGLAAVGTVGLPKPCTVAGTTATCAYPDGNVDTTLPLLIRPTAAAGTKGSFTVTTKADNVGGSSITAEVSLVDGVDLVAFAPSGDLGVAKPGDTRYTPMAFYNSGNRTASGVTMTIWLDHGVKPFAYQGCDYAQSQSHGTVMTCRIDMQVRPGEGLRWFTLDEKGNEVDGLGAGFEADAFGYKGVGFAAEGDGTVDSPLSHLTRQKVTGGKRFTLKPATRPAKLTDVNPDDNIAEGFYKVANSYDLETHGATASGKAGDIVKITIGEKNNGPATLDWTRSGGERGARFQFVPPPGVQVVKAPANCESVIENGDGSNHTETSAPGGKFYRCWTIDYLAAGDSVTAAFELKITQVIPDATGTVSFHDPYRTPPDPDPDTNPGNDRSLVVINPTTGGTGGGLPVTGAQAGLTAGAGVVLLAAGIGLYLLARRRRVVTAAGSDS